MITYIKQFYCTKYVTEFFNITYFSYVKKLIVFLMHRAPPVQITWTLYLG